MKKIYITKSAQTIIVNPLEAVDWEVITTKPQTAVVVLLFGFTGKIQLSVRLVSRGAEVQIIGVVVSTGDSIVALHTLQSHEAKETTSDLLVKSVIYDSAQFFYDGFIRVEEGAQKTNAYQRNENLLLSKDARADSRPGLEILADDVRCTHGATIAPISPEELWYLSARGITPSVGCRLIVNGFLAAAAQRILDLGVRDQVLREIDSKIRIN